MFIVNSHKASNAPTEEEQTCEPVTVTVQWRMYHITRALESIGTGRLRDYFRQGRAQTPPPPPIYHLVVCSPLQNNRCNISVDLSNFCFVSLKWKSRDSAVATGYALGWISGKGKGFFFSPQPSDRLCRPTRLLCYAYQGG
jgi:hypothetical protein